MSRKPTATHVPFSRFTLPDFTGDDAVDERLFVDALAEMLLNEFHGVGGWTFDPVGDCWVAPDTHYSGPGRRFCVYRRDGRAFRQVVPAEVIQ